MPKIKYFDDKGNLVKEVYEQLNENNFDVFRAQYGDERAAGYLEAMADFVESYDNIHPLSDKLYLNLVKEKFIKEKAFLERADVRELYSMDYKLTRPDWEIRNKNNLNSE